MDKVIPKVFKKVSYDSREALMHGGQGISSTPGTKTGQELNVQVTSRRWYPKPKPAVGVTISVVNGLHSINGEALQSGAITIDANSRYLQTMVMSDSDEYLKDTEATVLISGGGGSLIFTATTRAELVEPLTDIDNNMLTDIDLNTITGAV